DPHAAALAPDLPGAELRDLLVLPPQARLRPAGDPDPVPPLERELGGDDLLRLRQLLLAEGDRGRLGDVASVRDPARAASRAGGEVDRDDRDARARRHVRHVPPAPADDLCPRPRRRHVCLLVVRGAGRSKPGRRPGRGDIAPLKLVLDWDGTVTEVDSLHMVLLEFGDVAAYLRAEDDLGRSLTLHEVIAVEFSTVKAPLAEVVPWVVENVRIRPGFHELVERFRPLIVSSGF